MITEIETSYEPEPFDYRLRYRAAGRWFTLLGPDGQPARFRAEMEDAPRGQNVLVEVATAIKKFSTF